MKAEPGLFLEFFRGLFGGGDDILEILGVLASFCRPFQEQEEAVVYVDGKVCLAGTVMKQEAWMETFSLHAKEERRQVEGPYFRGFHCSAVSLNALTFDFGDNPFGFKLDFSYSVDTENRLQDATKPRFQFTLLIINSSAVRGALICQLAQAFDITFQFVLAFDQRF